MRKSCTSSDIEKRRGGFDEDYTQGDVECNAIPGFPDYLAYADGKIWSKRTNKFLIPAVDRKTGYNRVTMTNKGRKRKSCYVHRMIALAFLPNPDNLPQINHKDENKSNNKVSNLEWCNAKYNANYGTRNKRCKLSYGLERMRVMQRHATECRKRPVKCIENGKIYNSVVEAVVSVTGRKHANNGSNISRSCRCGASAYGYHWRWI